jgi:hypothetical protein
MADSETLAAANADRLRDEPNIWLATTRPDGRPHLVPIWFGFVNGRFYVCTSSNSVKVRNVTAAPHACVALENGSRPLFVDGQARVLRRPFPEPVKAEFARKFDWDLDAEPEYDAVVEINPTRWRGWN